MGKYGYGEMVACIFWMKLLKRRSGHTYGYGAINTHAFFYETTEEKMETDMGMGK